MCYTADRRKKGLEKGGYRESLTDTAEDKGHSGGTEELGAGRGCQGGPGGGELVLPETCDQLPLLVGKA